MAEGDKGRATGIPWWVTAASIVAVPVVVTLITQAVIFAQQSRDRDVRMVEIGVSLLAPDPSNDPKRGGARQWALEVMEKYSGIKFSQEAKDLVIGNPVQVDRQILQPTTTPAAPT